MCAMSFEGATEWRLNISCSETFVIGWRRDTDTGVYSAVTQPVNSQGSRIFWGSGQLWARGARARARARAAVAWEWLGLGE